MAEQDVGDKQFDATPHKLREAQKKGQVFKSRDLTQLLTFIVGFFMIWIYWHGVMDNCMDNRRHKRHC